ncbi:MAG: hypothetical protein LBS43_00855 [Prevotellaceae bacterium]|nr:hypothetical protein [Prevotellaceae bacterium]
MPIQEPVKFDGFTPVIKRGSYYGISPDQADNEIEFDREAGYALLKTLYEQYGVDAEIDFLCEYTCDGRGWDEYYSGQIDFAVLYEERYRNWCRVASTITANDIRVTFLNKRDDEIDLDSLLSRSGKTLTKYGNLGREILLPAKTIKTRLEAVQKYPDDEVQEQAITLYRSGEELTKSNCSDTTMWGKPFRSTLYIRLNTAEYAESGEVDEGLSISLPLNDTPEQPLMYVSMPDVDIFSGKLIVDISGKISYEFGQCGHIRSINAQTVKIIVGETVYEVASSLAGDCGNDLEFSIHEEYDVLKFEGNIDVKMDLLAYVGEAYGYIMPEEPCPEFFSTREANLTIDSGSYVRFDGNSQYSDTPAKLYLIHESLSRIAEHLTDGALTVKSDYYGRVDSDVHKTSEDGRASLRAITNGYLVRQAVMTDGTTPKMFVSWKKLFESLQAIDNVGFGFEAGGVIRVEPMEFFYKNDVIMTCDGINEHTIKFDTESNIRSVKTGYKKWLSGEYNSIDGFHATREYHTSVEKAVVAKEYLSELIADGYAIEATRRRQIADNLKDWQYDNDLFIIDLRRGTTSDNVIEVNKGATDTGGTLIDPDTIYNARLSPARMAMRHFAGITRGMPPVYRRALMFGASEGYSTARMRAQGNYVIEKNAIVENQDISVDDFFNAAELLLDVSAEIMTFKYPIKPYEFRHIREHPYGLVDADGRLGWLKELEWETGKETANFTLILKR